MKRLLPYFLFFTAFLCSAQDKVYFLDGTSRNGKITEIGSDYVVLELQGPTYENIEKQNILLLEFKNGNIEVVNRPEKALVYNPSSDEQPRTLAGRSEQENYNLGSVNTLALCNADVAGFYERILPGKKVGLGLMGAYNFNVHATFSNLFIAVLDNAKKKYDLGVFANVYVRGYSSGTSFYYGIMLKYMRFRFSSVIEEKVTVGGQVSTNIKYRTSEASQLATLFTCGTHTNLNNNFFFRSLVGIGGFNMHGEYRRQYNYQLNKANQASPTPDPYTYNRRFLLKFYIGINLGFTF